MNAKKRGLTSNDILILACYVLPLAVIGARIYYVIFSLDEFSSFWQVFEIWNGGLAIYGGVIGGAVAIMLYCLIHKKNFFAVADIRSGFFDFGAGYWKGRLLFLRLLLWN